MAVEYHRGKKKRKLFGGKEFAVTYKIYHLKLKPFCFFQLIFSHLDCFDDITFNTFLVIHFILLEIGEKQNTHHANTESQQNKELNYEQLLQVAPSLSSIDLLSLSLGTITWVLLLVSQ